MADIKDWQSLAKIDPEWEEVTKAAGGSPDFGLFPDIPTLRAWIIAAKQNTVAVVESVPGVKEEKDHQVPVRDGSKITVRTYHPEKEGGPLAVIYHGGGWCIGGLENEELLCRRLCGRLGFVVANVDYRLAPEHKFPVPVTDSWDAMKWIVENASSLGADPSKAFIVGGTSAGGNITAIVAHLAADEKLSPPITGTLYIIPSVCHSEFFPEKYKHEMISWDQNKDAPILSRKACDLFFGNYIQEGQSRDDKFLSPMLWPTGHKGQPPAYFQICGADPLRDEALIYERMLREDEGVSTKVDMYAGQPHGFWSMFPKMKASQQFMEDSVKAVEWLLKQNA